MCPPQTHYWLHNWYIPNTWSCDDFNWLWWMLSAKEVGQSWENISAEAQVCCEWEFPWWLLTEEHKSFCITGNRILKMPSWAFPQEILSYEILHSQYLLLFHKYFTKTQGEMQFMKCSNWETNTIWGKLCFLRNKIKWRK